MPESTDVAVTAQRRDGDQTELTIDYVLATRPDRSRLPWLLGSLAAGAILCALVGVRATIRQRWR